MTQKVRLWGISEGNKLVEIPATGIEAEKNLEDWIAVDIAILDPDLLVIGRQVTTAYGGTLDLLCLDSNGDTVVVELKRDKTPRDVTAQALDYASWVKDLSAEDITTIADKYLSTVGKGPLQVAFQQQFDGSLPEELNLSHRSLIVAESMDASTERIVQYLSDMNVPINVATVQHFIDASGNRLLAQVYLIEPQEAESRARATSRRTGPLTIGNMLQRADGSGLRDLFEHLNASVREPLPEQPRPYPYGNQMWYRIRDEGRIQTLLKAWVVPDQEQEGIPVLVHASRISNRFEIDHDQLRLFLPDPKDADADVRLWGGSSEEEKRGALGIKAYFTSTGQIDTFVNGLKQAQQRQQNKGE